MLMKLLKNMLKISLILLFFISFLYAEDIEETDYMRRIDEGLYNRSYRGNSPKKKAKKMKFEDIFRGEEVEVGEEDIFPKRSSYTGIYKVGKPYSVFGQDYTPKEDENYEKEGISSHYGDGDGFHGKRTSNGETYNMHDFTAAHPTLPLPSIVEITNLDNGKKVKVRVNDRGPFTKNRIIDVSKTVAKALGFYGQGTGRVRVKYLKKDSDELLKHLGLVRK
ncbi:MAG: hypothetical protein Ta2D_05710 [Rickettsiales bacterium]|nr:MAG: hypothetical protein Ta2D_05710 [Rickettsiales bacterium]